MAVYHFAMLYIYIYMYTCCCHVIHFSFLASNAVIVRFMYIFKLNSDVFYLLFFFALLLN